MWAKKLEQLSTILFLVVMFSFTSVIGYWVVLDKHPTTVQYTHEKVLIQPVTSREAITSNLETTIVQPGKQYFIYSEYCVDRNIPGQVFRIFQNDIIIRTPPIPTFSQVGCWKRSFPVQIPSELRGNYRIKTIIRTAINPIRTVDHIGLPIEITINVD